MESEQTYLFGPVYTGDDFSNGQSWVWIWKECRLSPINVYISMFQIFLAIASNFHFFLYKAHNGLNQRNYSVDYWVPL